MPRAFVLLPLVLNACGARSVRDGIDGDDVETDADADTDVTSDADADADSDTDGELDLGPDARPSDYPEAANWTDADPAAIEGEPCCELVGGPVQVDDAETHSRAGLVGWNGDGWGVVWTASWTGADGALLFQALDQDGLRVGPTAQTATGHHSGAFDLEWGWDRYGVSIYTPREDFNAITMLGAGGESLTDFTLLDADATTPSIARYRHGDGWVVTYAREIEGYESPLEVIWVNDDGSIEGDPKPLGTSISAAAPVVGLASRAASVWAGSSGIQFRSFTWPDVESEPADFTILAMPTIEDTTPDLVAYRDYAAVAVDNGDEATVMLVDPWEDRVVAGPGAIGTCDGTNSGAVVRLVPAEERGFLGACWLSRYPRMADMVGEISFGLVGPDATPWGEPIVVASEPNVGGCAAGWNGQEFLVLLWRHREDSSVWVQRIRPGI